MCIDAKGPCAGGIAGVAHSLQVGDCPLRDSGHHGLVRRSGSRKGGRSGKEGSDEALSDLHGD